LKFSLTSDTFGTMSCSQFKIGSDLNSSKSGAGATV